MATIITTPSGIWSTIVISGQRHRRLLAKCNLMDVLLLSHAAKWEHYVLTNEWYCR
jgi:hypothetical protein